jgi:hypothetical protein
MSNLVQESYDLFSQSFEARSPEDIRKSSDKILDRAIEEAKYASARESQANILGALDVTEEGQLSDLEYVTYSKEQFKDILAGFALSKGNFSPDRYWIRIEKFKIFVCFPMLAVAPFHGALQWALAPRMAQAIRDGKSSNLIDYVERSYRIDKKHRVYLFAKGYTLGEDKEAAMALREDIGRIIRSMTENKGVTNPKPDLELNTIRLMKKPKV